MFQPLLLKLLKSAKTKHGRKPCLFSSCYLSFLSSLFQQGSDMVDTFGSPMCFKIQIFSGNTHKELQEWKFVHQGSSDISKAKYQLSNDRQNKKLADNSLAILPLLFPSDQLVRNRIGCIKIIFISLQQVCYWSRNLRKISVPQNCNCHWDAQG